MLSVATRVMRKAAPPVKEHYHHHGAMSSLDECLRCWDAYMSASGGRDLGCKTTRLMIAANDVFCDDNVNDKQFMNDVKVGESVNACITSLTRIEQWAIGKSRGFCRVWNFPRADYEAVLTSATKNLIEKLKKHSCTSNKF